MKNTYFLITVLFALGQISCFTSKNLTMNSDSHKTIINYSKTLSSEQANDIVKLLNKEFKDFPQQSLPIRYDNTTDHSALNIHLKENKVKLKYRSKLDEENEEVAMVNRIRESIIQL